MDGSGLRFAARELSGRRCVDGSRTVEVCDEAALQAAEQALRVAVCFQPRAFVRRAASGDALAGGRSVFGEPDAMIVRRADDEGVRDEQQQHDRRALRRPATVMSSTRGNAQVENL